MSDLHLPRPTTLSASRVVLLVVSTASFLLLGVPYLLFENGVTLNGFAGVLPMGFLLTYGIPLYLLLTFGAFYWALAAGPDAFTRSGATPAPSPGDSRKPAQDPWRARTRSSVLARRLGTLSVFIGIVLPVCLFSAMPFLIRYDSTAWGWGLLWFFVGLPVALLSGLIALCACVSGLHIKSKRIASQRCMRCGYCLSGTVQDGDNVTCCPECGERWRLA